MSIQNQYKTTEQLLTKARKDPDAVSSFLNGTCIEDTQEAVFIVKGAKKVRQVLALLTANGLTSSNPVDPMCAGEES